MFFSVKTMCRFLYDDYLADVKWTHVVKIDMAWIYFSDCKEKDLFTTKKSSKRPKILAQ